MTEEMIFNFDFEGVAPIDEPEFTPIVTFGKFHLAKSMRIQLFVSGAQIEVPEIQIDNGDGTKSPFTRKGMKTGGKTMAYFFACTQDKKDGGEFTEVRIFTSQGNIPVDADKIDKYPVILLNDKQLQHKQAGETVWLCDWSNLQVPAIQADRSKATIIGNGKPFWGSAKNWNTGKKPNVVNEGTEDEKKYYERYWYDFVIYNSKEEMVAARDAHFAALKDGNIGVSNGVMWPKDWCQDDASLQATIDFGKAKWQEFKNKEKVREALYLTPAMVDTAGNPVNIDNILNHICAVDF